MNYREHAEQLINEFNLCLQAKPKHNAIDVQLEKDSVSKWACNLNNQLGWGSESEIAEACHQLEPRLQRLKEKLVMEILTNGII
jgi:hypothetical protein